MFVYLDESGDLGFGENSSRYFVITVLKAKEEGGLKRCIKKIRQRGLKKKLMQVPELKANNSTPHIRRKVLQDLAGLDIEIHCLILPKEKVYSRLREVKFKLYNYVVGLILPGAIAIHREIVLVVDRLTKRKIIRDDFDAYVQTKIEERAFLKPKITISHYDSRNSPGLQACYFVSWAIFRKYELGDESYYRIIKGRIKNEFRLFEK